TADVVFVGPPQMVTSLPVYPGQEVQFNLTISNQGQADVATQFFVNLFLDATVDLTNTIPISGSAGYTAVSSLAAGLSKTITVTAPAGFNIGSNPHTVVGVIDGRTFNQPQNIVSEPLYVDVAEPWHLFFPIIWRD
ncbi:MAG: hypothetical protein GY796_01865, partial [Chloroflexi bacterium]|nr:hypothetical protein [Chloroflexota bacterium]